MVAPNPAPGEIQLADNLAQTTTSWTGPVPDDAAGYSYFIVVRKVGDSVTGGASAVVAFAP